MVPDNSSALREMSKLSLDISELLHRPGTSKRLDFSEEIEGLGLEMGRVQPQLDFSLELSSLVEGILVSGRVRGTYVLECIRCLTEFDQRLEVDVSEVLAYESQPGAEEGYEIAGDHAFLEPVMRDAVILAMPLNPLCRPDCKGLCPVCGADRNSTDCGHDAGRKDLRWVPLEQLKDALGE